MKENHIGSAAVREIQTDIQLLLLIKFKLSFFIQIKFYLPVLISIIIFWNISNIQDIIITRISKTNNFTLIPVKSRYDLKAYQQQSLYFLLAATIRKILKGFFLGGGRENFFLEAISLGKVVPSPKLVINLLRTYEKLSCKGEPYQFSCQQTDTQTDKETNILLLYYKDNFTFEFSII